MVLELRPAPFLVYSTVEYRRKNFDMIKVFSPDQYKKIPWKNGKGETTELAISEGGSIDQFEWRISIASVLEDGPFSDFSGYMRHLVLIDGAGIDLEHDGSAIDMLDKVLSIATFEGSCKTLGTLKAGPIIDFNLMTKIGCYQATVQTYPAIEKLLLDQCDLCFIYSLNRPLTISVANAGKGRVFPPEHLIEISGQSMHQYALSGHNLIVIYLNSL